MIGLDMASRERYYLNPHIGKDSFRERRYNLNDVSRAVIIMARNDFSMFRDVIISAVRKHPEDKSEIVEFYNEVERRRNDDNFEEWVYNRMKRAAIEEGYSF